VTEPAPASRPDWAATLHWGLPWQWHLTACAPLVSQSLARGQGVVELANQIAQQLPEPARPGVRFTAQSNLPPGQAYEAFIFQTRLCPSRDNLHDLFNALTWLVLPRTKARLNALQAGEIERCGVVGRRGPLRDALTLFDENGAVLWAPPALSQALVERDWRRLFIEHRALWAQARLLVFGHALQEKLLQPRKALTAHVYLPQGQWPCLQMDEALAQEVQASSWSEKPYWPLPLLGVPGWYLPNENFSFYDDASVFRPADGKARKPQLEKARPASI